MQATKKSSILVLGLALFSMFFGSGNLIFPLSIGQLSQDHFMWGLSGFVFTGVLLPFLGVLTTTIYGGDYTKFLGSNTKIGFIFTLALLTVWIPLGAGPRCITLSYVNVNSFIDHIPLWAYSIVYCALLFPLSYRKSRAFDILGYVLTPLLLLCLGFIVYEGFILSEGFGKAKVGSSTLFYTGLLEGYHTMDLIASFFFTTTIFATLKEVSNGSTDTKTLLKTALRASIVGVVILAVVYLGLVVVAASNASLLAGVPKDQLLAKLVAELLGPKLQIVATMAIILACVTTSIALQIVYSDFLTNTVFKGKISLRTGMIITLIMTFGMSIQGFEGISRLTGPVLEVFYPMLIVLMLWNIAIYPLIKKCRGSVKRIA